ncbi:unnamed protein product [Caenorhabditis sp. 36 PRJEB53466]|nr:unnamed protein product [Caenorhabditis sp. 36 PRJEB53466]
MLLLFLFNVSISVLTVVHCSSSAPRPTENRRPNRLSRDPNINSDVHEKYVPMLPEWDSQMPDVLDELVSVQKKVKAEDGRETAIENL